METSMTNLFIFAQVEHLKIRKALVFANLSKGGKCIGES